MKIIFLLSLFVSFSAFAAKTQDLLQAIADSAEVANGSAEVKKGTYSTKTVAADIKYWKGRWDNCTFSKPYVDDKALKALADYSFDKATVDAIKKLQKSNLVTKVSGFETDHDVSCSQIWVNVYTKDGYVLELWYGMGD